MYVERIPNRNSPPAILLRESYRDGDKIRKRTLANLSDWPGAKIEALRRVLRGDAVASVGREALSMQRSLPHGHVAAALGTLRKLGLDRLLSQGGRQPKQEVALCVAMIVARLIEPASKLATARLLDAETATCSLGQVLGLGAVDEQQLYGALDWLVEQQERIEKALVQRHLKSGTLVLYDVSSTYFEGRTCELAQFGHNRDGKHGKLQIVFGLLCSQDGCPVAIEVFEGNVGDPSTLQTEITSLDYPGERLVVCRNPLLAEERARKRRELLAATEEKLRKIQARVRRAKRSLRGRDAIGIAVGKIIDRYKMAKHFDITITDDDLIIERRSQPIDDEALLDGFYVVRTNVKAELLDSSSVVGAYKGLSNVERAFRSLKTVDIEIRPIHHRRGRRVRAHVLLCMLAYYLEWHMRQALKPILFDDHDKPAADAARGSIVAKAVRSEAAKRKVNARRTDDDLPVHSFQSLIADLATFTRNTMAMGDSSATFLLYPKLTPTQERAFRLLDVPASL